MCKYVIKYWNLLKSDFTQVILKRDLIHVFFQAFPPLKHRYLINVLPC